MSATIQKVVRFAALHRRADMRLINAPVDRSLRPDRKRATLAAMVAAAFNSRVTGNVVRLGVNYKFDPSYIRGY